MFIPENTSGAVGVSGDELLPAIAALDHVQKFKDLTEPVRTEVEADFNGLYTQYLLQDAAFSSGILIGEFSATVGSPELFEEGLVLVRDSLALKGLQRILPNLKQRRRLRVVESMLEQLPNLQLTGQNP